MKAATENSSAPAPQGEGAQKSPAAPALEALRLELSRRVEKNPRYSLRSFARDLGVSHTLLSLVLNGRRPPSPAIIERLGELCRFSPAKTARLLASRKNPKARADFAGKGYEKLSLDQFALISEWQHYAILSLLEIPDTKFEPKFVAERLGISPVLAKISLQRLVSLGIVEQAVDGRWRQRSGPIVVENVTSTAHTRKFQGQLLAKAVESLQNDSMEKRDVSSTTFAMHPKHVPHALQRIRQFRRELSAELEAFGEPEEVYNLTVQIFPTSKRKKS